MLSKTIFDQAMSRLKSGAITVDFGGGEIKTYGKGEPYFTMIVHDPKAIDAIVKQLDLGFGEAYMDGQLDIEGPLDQVMRLSEENHEALASFGKYLKYRPRRNVKHTQQGLIAHHYDLGNDFYKLWLDKSMTYSCAYFARPDITLEEAQTAKIEHVLRKLVLKPGMKLVDIGSGWGGLMIAAAKKFKVSGLGITLSKEQLAGSRMAAKKAGVADKVSFELMNYQDLAKSGQQFDRVVCVGMYEHVGRGNHKTYMEAVSKLLAPGGVSLLHTITQQTEEAMPPWIDKYIFPGGYIPSLRETLWLMPEHGFRILDVENLRPHYALTLDEWWRRFERSVETVRRMYDERFVRMWRLYLAGSSASFRYGGNELAQIVFSKGINQDLPLTRAGLYQ